MATELKNFLRKRGSSEATLASQVLAGQWFFATDTRRIGAKHPDGVTMDYFWSAHNLADQSGAQGSAVIGTPGITGVTPTGGSSGAAGTLQAMLAGGFSGAGNTNFLATAPGSNSRNVVQPSGDYYALALRANASQTQALQRWESSAGAPRSTVTAAGEWATSWANAGGTNTLTVDNTDNTNTASHARHLIRSGGSSGGDPYTTWQVNAGGATSFGIDNSVTGDPAVWSYSTALGTSNIISSNASAMTITPAVTMSSTLGVAGNLTVGSDAGDGNSLTLNSAAGKSRYTIYASAGSLRWAAGVPPIAESGSDAGAPWVLEAYTDAGALIDLPISITRAAGGTMTLARPVSMSSTLGVTGNIYFDASPGVLRANADDRLVQIAGGSAGSLTNGAVVSAYGNTHASEAGRLYLRAGTVGTGDIIFGTNNTTRLTIANGGTSTFSGPLVASSTLGVTGVATFTAAPVFNSVTASQFLLVDGSKALTSVGATGSGDVVRATSPTLVTPVLGAATGTSLTLSGDLTANRIGIGTSPSYDFHLRKTASGGIVSLIENLDSTGSSLFQIISQSSGGSEINMVNGVSAGGMRLTSLVSGALRLYTDYGTVLTLASTGQATLANSLTVNGDFIKAPVRTSDPSSPEDGMFYYNSSQGHFYFRSAGSWVEIA